MLDLKEKKVMPSFAVTGADLSREKMAVALTQLQKEYQNYQAKQLRLDMSRGKPGPDQLDLSFPMMQVFTSSEDFYTEDQIDVRNYGFLEGLPEARKLMGSMLGVSPEMVIVGGNSSLNLMYDCISQAFLFGFGGEKPWSKLQSVKFLCPVPGYDRHFAICENFGIEMIPVAMDENGPDMNRIEQLVQQDEAIKGIWCVPKFANPGGQVYSDEVVRRFANLAPKAKDFRVFWDNAYCVHELYGPVVLSDIFSYAQKAGKEDLVLAFCSTSKVSFSGAGIAALAASPNNLAAIKKHMATQTIGFDKINQLRHARYFKDLDGINKHMQKHAQIIAPKFQLVLQVLEKSFGKDGAVRWSEPRGGYFISLDVPAGCAKRAVQLCREAGVTLTPAGAAYPYGNDPDDRNIRIAPTYPSLCELQTAADVLCLCIKIAMAEKALQE